MIPAYCDFIAEMIQMALRHNASLIDAEIQLLAGNTKIDLHPKEGYMLSTKRTIDVVDQNNTKYKITIEEVDDDERLQNLADATYQEYRDEEG